jgi:hypothetical protein
MLVGLFLLMTANKSSATLLLVEQYDNYWSTSLAALKNYASNNVADSFSLWGKIDFTDDPLDSQV